MIYGIVLEGDDSVVKVGHTGSGSRASRPSALTRMKQMQTGNWRKLVCVSMSPGTRDDEQALHLEFAHYHVRGEWFLNHGEVHEWVVTHAVEPFVANTGDPAWMKARTPEQPAPAMKQPTGRQAEIHRYMLERQSDGATARFRDIGNRFGISSTNGVADHIKALARKGLVVRSGARWVAVDAQHNTELVMSGSLDI